MKKVLIPLFLFIAIVAKGQTHMGDKIIFHLSPSAAALNNGISHAAAVAVSEPNGSNESTIFIFADGGALYSSFQVFTSLRKCTSQSDATTNGDCWSTLAEAAAWLDVNTVLFEEDTVGNPGGRIMTLYSAETAIAEIEADIATKSPIGHTHSFASNTSKPTTLSGYGITDAYPLSGNPSGFLTSFTEVDGSTTNEIELPSQSGNSGRVLSTNGSSPSWVVPSTAPGTNNVTAYASGTTYNLTNSSAKIDFGTNDPSITLTTPGTYLIISNVKVDFTGLTTLATQTCNFKLRRSSNTAADLPSATANFFVPIVTLLTQTGGDCDTAPVIYTTTNSNDVIELWGNRGANLSAGNITVGEASIVAIRIY